MTTANTNSETTEISVIEGLAAQARALRMSVELNLWQLARVLMEAQQLVPRGQWAQWVEENAGFSERKAQQSIQAYKRFSENPLLQNVGKSNLFKLLALPEGTEDTFIETHDLTNMTAREVERAVKQARAEMREEIENERGERMNAEQRAANANAELQAMKDRMAAQPEIPEEITREMAEKDARIAAAETEISRLTETGNTMLEESRRIASENSSLKQEIREQKAMLEEQQEDLNRAQAELLNAKSVLAKGDAERVPSDQLTPEAFAAAVRQFIGSVARMPHMRSTFGGMSEETKEEYSILLETVEKWARDSRKALETTGSEGTVL